MVARLKLTQQPVDMDVAGGQVEKHLRPGQKGPVISDVVDHVKMRLCIQFSQPSAELLEPQDPRFGGAQHEDRVDRRHVDALVQDIDGKDDVEFAVAQLFERSGSWIRVCVGMNGGGPQACVAKEIAHEIRVASRGAKAKGPVSTSGSELVQSILCPGLGGESVRQRFGVEAVAPPWDIFVVDIIGHAEVVKGAEQAFRDPLCEVAPEDQVVARKAKEITTIGSLGRGGEAQKEFGLEVVDEFSVGFCRGVMKFVDDQVVKLVGPKAFEVLRPSQGLDGSKHDICTGGLFGSCVQAE